MIEKIKNFQNEAAEETGSGMKDWILRYAAGSSSSEEDEESQEISGKKPQQVDPVSK